MGEQELERLVVVMRALSDGDGAAVVWLLEEFGPRIRASIRRHLDRLGVRPAAELLAELTVEACLTLQGCAGGWRPTGGALPWVWAERRLFKMTSDYVGQHHDPLDETDEVDAARARWGPATLDDADEAEEIDVLRRLAAARPRAAVLLAALEEATSPRERAVLLAYEVHKAAGHPAPAASVGARLALTPANVRQIAKRARDKIGALVDADTRYAAISSIPMLERAS